MVFLTSFEILETKELELYVNMLKFEQKSFDL